MKNNIIFLSGLPRTGSTLLTSILGQNPNIHTESDSALCQLMWDMQVSCENTEQIKNRLDIPEKLLSTLPNLFYEGVNCNIIDKCRSWTLPSNLELIDKYITKTPKIIVMLRPIVDVVKSFVYIRKMNNWENPEMGVLDEDTEPIMRSLNGVIHAKEINKGQFLFVEYDDLIRDTKRIISSIYEFCEYENYEHSFQNITNFNLEKYNPSGLVGLHDIRPNISKRKIDIKLSPELHEKALFYDKVLV